MILSLNTLRSFATLTGQISNTTKIGRLAKMLESEIILKKSNTMKFSAFGDNLIGKTVKAICISQEGFNSGVARGSLQVTPEFLESDEKIRDSIPSIELLIKADEPHYPPHRDVVVINVSSSTSYTALAKQIHEVYKREDYYQVRCMGYSQCATVIKALALFNKNVESHRLVTRIVTENVPNMYLRIRDDDMEEKTTTTSEKNESLRAIVFSVNVVSR